MSSNSTDTEVFVYRDMSWIDVLLPWVLVAFGAIAALYGLRAFYLGIRDLNQAKASVAWPTRPGKVLSSSVVQKRDSEGDLTHHAEVVYVFNVNNTAYSGTRIAYGDYGSSNTSLPKKL